MVVINYFEPGFNYISDQKKMSSRPHQLFLFLIIFVFIPASLAGQLPLRNFYFKHIKTEQGLSNGVIWTMMKDKEGFLWIVAFSRL